MQQYQKNPEELPTVLEAAAVDDPVIVAPLAIAVDTLRPVWLTLADPVSLAEPDSLAELEAADSLAELEEADSLAELDALDSLAELDALAEDNIAEPLDEEGLFTDSQIWFRTHAYKDR